MDGSYIICTPDHPFLPNSKKYIQSKEVYESKGSIVPFKRAISTRGYWQIRKSSKREEFKNMYCFLMMIMICKDSIFTIKITIRQTIP